MTQFTHPTAIIDPGAIIGAGTKIWHWVHVSSKAHIGKNCSLGQNVFIGNNVSIADNVKIQNNVSVYDGVILENDVFCGPSMVFTNVNTPRSAVDRKSQFSPTLVKAGASLGANCTIICGVTIGTGAFVGAGTVVTQDIPDYALVVGVPGKQIGWMSEYGNKLALPVSGNGIAECDDSKVSYQLTGHILKKLG